jgi:hypothetical protein
MDTLFENLSFGEQSLIFFGSLLVLFIVVLVGIFLYEQRTRLFKTTFKKLDDHGEPTFIVPSPNVVLRPAFTLKTKPENERKDIYPTHKYNHLWDILEDKKDRYLYILYSSEKA